MMKVSQLMADLVEVLEELGDVDIILSRDPEGNGFHELAYYSIRIKNGDDPEDFYDATSDAEDVELSEEEWEKIRKENPRILVLWP